MYSFAIYLQDMILALVNIKAFLRYDFQRWHLYTVDLAIFARRANSRIEESRQNYYYNSTTKEKWKFVNSKLREKYKSKKFTKIWPRENYQIYSMLTVFSGHMTPSLTLSYMFTVFSGHMIPAMTPSLTMGTTRIPTRHLTLALSRPRIPRSLRRVQSPWEMRWYLVRLRPPPHHLLPAGPPAFPFCPTTESSRSPPMCPPGIAWPTPACRESRLTVTLRSLTCQPLGLVSVVYKRAWVFT